MSDNNNDGNINKITIKFEGSFCEGENNIPSQKLAIKNPVKYRTKDLNKNQKKLKENLSKDKINTKNKHPTFQINGNKKINLLQNNNKNNINNKTSFMIKSKKYTMSNHFPNTTRQIEKYNINEKRKFYNTINIPNSSTYEIYKAKQNSYREKKLYEERVKLLKNHINALKKQEEEMNRKDKINKERENNKNQRRKEKEIIKQDLLSMEIDKSNALEENKRYIMKQKVKNSIGLKESQKKIKKEKIKKYKEAYKDRKEVEEIRNEINNKYEENNLIQIKKIQKEREQIKEKNRRKRNEDIDRISTSYKMSYETNIIETEKLKKELQNLELLEEQYLENLKKSQDYINKNNEEIFRRNFFKKIKFNNNIFNNYNSNNNLRKKANSAEKRNEKNSIDSQKIILNINKKVKTNSLSKAKKKKDD